MPGGHMWDWIGLMDDSEYSDYLINLSDKLLIADSRLSESIRNDVDSVFFILKVGD